MSLNRTVIIIERPVTEGPVAEKPFSDALPAKGFRWRRSAYCLHQPTDFHRPEGGKDSGLCRIRHKPESLPLPGWVRIACCRMANCRPVEMFGYSASSWKRARFSARSEKSFIPFRKGFDPVTGDRRDRLVKEVPKEGFDFGSWRALQVQSVERRSILQPDRRGTNMRLVRS
jgi:hypothetical protein